MNAYIAISAALLIIVAPAPAVLAWSNCGTPKAESDCPPVATQTPVPTPAATPAPTSPPVATPSSTPAPAHAGGPSGGNHTVAICHAEDENKTGVQSVEQRNVQPDRVKFYLSSASGLDYLMDPAIGNCGPTVP